MRADPGRESLRWGRAVQACDTQLGLQTRAIHGMDREGDSYDLLAELHAAGARYVIRLRQLRSGLAAQPEGPRGHGDGA